MASVKIKALPEKLQADILDDDVLILEDEQLTRHIKMSELMTYVMNKVQSRIEENLTQSEILETDLKAMVQSAFKYPVTTEGVENGE